MSVEEVERKLVIVDVSALMRTNYRPEGVRGSLSIDVGGKSLTTSHIFGLFRVIKEYGVDAHYVFCYDTPINYLQKENPEYKAGRVKVADEYFQGYTLAKEILRAANFTVLSKEGYEADHLIMQAKNDLAPYYTKVYVITNDRDLAVVVDEKTTWVNTIKKRGHITLENYEEVLGCPYNAIHLKKALVGDPSDNLKGVYRFGEAKFKQFVIDEGVYQQNVYGKEREVILESGLTDDQKDQALSDLRIIKGLVVSNINLTLQEIDWEIMVRAAEELGMKSLIKTFSI